MNTVKLSEIRNELFGDDDGFKNANLGKIFNLQRWLGISGNDPCYKSPNRLRMATSLNARAELELFGLSSPRFCVRLYLDAKHHSFLNLRRSNLLAVHFRDHCGWANRSAPIERRIEEVVEKPMPQVEKSGLIGDSVFAVPAKFLGRYHVISRDLHADYGEFLGDPETREHVPSTPFVEYFWTNGLCTHAVIFITSMLMYDHVKSIHALPEIAALLANGEKSEMVITGLSPRHIAKYFAHPDVGLQAFYQLTPCSYSLDVVGWKVDEVVCFRNALRSYLLSGMPIIKYVDLNRLHGVAGDFDDRKGSIYDRNKAPLKFDRDGTQHPPDVHCLAIFGCSTRNGDDFLLHDPGGFPYLEADARQLMKAASYSTPTSSSADGPTLTSRYFQPVTPALVKLPLHKKVIRRDRENCLLPGLFEIALQHFRSLETANTDWRPSPDEFLAGEFRLVRGSGILSAFNNLEWSASSGVDPNLASAVATIAMKLGAAHSEHWFWVQKFRRSFWVWDAQLSSPLDMELETLYKYQIASASDQSDQPHHFMEPSGRNTEPATLMSSAFQAASEHVQPDCEGGDLTVSLLSSFHPRGLGDASASWPVGVEYAELYAFMHHDALFLAPNAPRVGRSAGTGNVTDAGCVGGRLGGV